jgi:hypothetical protein
VALPPERLTLTASDSLVIRPDGASRISLSLAEGALVSRLSVGGKEIPLIPSPFREGMLGFAVPEEARRGTLVVTVSYKRPSTIRARAPRQRRGPRVRG